jgi:hypothetical protein
MASTSQFDGVLLSIAQQMGNSGAGGIEEVSGNGSL